MGQLIGYEFWKIVDKKMVYVSLLFLIFFNGMACCMGMFGEKVITTEGELLEGLEAVRYMQEFDRRYQGVLTDEKIAEIYDNSYPQEAVEKAEGFFFEYLPDIISYVDSRFYAPAGTKAADVITPEMGEVHVGYHKGYSMQLFSMMDVMLVAGCVILIAIAPVFAEEYTKGTDALVLTAKYGKTLLVRAKVAAAFLFSAVLWAAMVAVNGIVFLLTYGTEGWDTSVQVDCLGWNWEIPYEMNYAQLTGYAVLMWLVASLLLTGITLVISACCNTSFAAVIFAAACYVVPVWFRIPAWSKMVMPAYQMQPHTVLNYKYLSAFGQKIMPLWIAVGVSSAAILCFVIWARKKFAGRQVNG